MKRKVDGLTILMIVLICMFTSSVAFRVVLEPVVVQGESMFPTIHEGDLVFGIRSRFIHQYRKGDIVIINTIRDGTDKTLIKRIIGVAGDKVVVDYDNSRIMVNGQELDEPYIKTAMIQPNSATISECVVPENCVFVMGDNRNISIDSRSELVGTPNISQISSRAIVFSTG